MIISKYFTLLTLALLSIFWSQTFGASSVVLKSGDTLSGEISSFKDNSIILASPVAHEPLCIDIAAIELILFDKHTNSMEPQGEMVTLTNGCVLPCDVISLDAKKLKIITSYAGEFNIDRSFISMIRFGVDNQEIIHNGNDPLNSWTMEGKWSKPDSKTIRSEGDGSLSRKLELPENLLITYSISWSSVPNFVFKFCGENGSAKTMQNCYEYTFNSAGMQIRRYQRNAKNPAPLAQIELKPSKFERRNIKLDFHINRKEGLITFYVDDKKIGTYPDQLEKSIGEYIIFSNRARQNQITIKNLTVKDLNNGGALRFYETSKKIVSDTFLDSDGNIRSGEIFKISRAENKKRIMLMKGKFNASPLSVPDHKISLLSFTQKDNSPHFPESNFVATLLQNGQLKLSNLELIDGYLEAVHPILGNCKIDIKALLSLSKQANQKSSGRQ